MSEDLQGYPKMLYAAAYVAAAEALAQATDERAKLAARQAQTAACRIVHSADEQRALGPGWHESPMLAIEPAPDPESESVPVKKGKRA